VRQTLSIAMGVLTVVEAILLAACGLAAHLLLHPAGGPAGWYPATALALGIASMPMLRLFGAYRVASNEPFDPRVFQALAGWVAVVAAFLAFLNLTQTTEAYARSWIVATFGLGCLVLLVARAVSLRYLRRLGQEGRLGPRVAVIGNGRALHEVAQAVLRDPLGLARLIEAHDLAPSTDAALQRLVRTIRAGKVSEVLIAVDGPSRLSDGAPDGRDDTLERLMATLKSEAVAVYLALPSSLRPLPVLGFDRPAGVPALALSELPLSGWSSVVKRIEDLVLGGVLLLLAAPMMAVIALAILVCMGRPVMFRQQRHGFNNNTFAVYKFRTMSAADDGAVVEQARRNDPRITPLGRLLRRTSLDELPQFLNVLRGDMSLVGPRPHAVSHNTRYAASIDGYLGRHRVKPGITGWAQVNGLRGETDTPEKMRRRLEYDLHYIENWSLLLDLRIIAQTITILIGDRNAY